MAESDGGDGAGLEVRRRLFAQIARVVLEAASEPLPLRLCRSFVQATGAEGGAITLAYTHPERTTLCATDGVADRLEDLQEVLGQGPGAEAFELGAPVTGDFADESDTRWTVLGEEIRAGFGPLQLRAFPMRTPPSTLGVITVYGHGAWSVPGPDEHELGLLADAIGAAIVHESQQTPESPAWGTRDRINQATGMVVAQLGIRPDDALALIRAFAFSHAMELQQVADEILTRRQDFSHNADYRGEA